MYNYPYFKPSLLSRGLTYAKTVNWSTLLDGTQKTLGVINQAIPIVYQVKPIVSNAKTIFKIANSLKSNNTNTNSEPTKNNTTYQSDISNENKPIFYI